MIKISFKTPDGEGWVHNSLPDGAAKCWLLDQYGGLQVVLKGSERRLHATYEYDLTIVPNAHLNLVAVELTCNEDGVYSFDTFHPIVYWKVDPEYPYPIPCYGGMDSFSAHDVAVKDQFTGQVTCAGDTYRDLDAYLASKNAEASK